MFCGHLCTSFCLTPVSNSLGFRISSGIAGSPDRNSVSNYLRNRQSVFHSGCTVLHPHQQYIKVLVSPQSRKHLALPIILILALFKCLSAIWVFSLMVSVEIFCHFFIRRSVSFIIVFSRSFVYSLYYYFI